jgi:hypothetical protein
MKKILLTVVMAVALCFYVSGASANGIVLNGTVDDFGTGFGNVSNILTLQNNGTEKGSILWNGTSDALTGDASNTSKTWLFSDIVGKGITDASQFGIVYNVNQQGNLGDTTLNSFTLQVYGPSGGSPVFETSDCPDCGPGFDPIENGTGGAGYLFVLDAQAQGFLATYFTNPDSFRLGATGDISLSNGGPENFFFVKLSEATKVPEPGTFLLLGVGLIGLAGAGRRRFKNR